MKRFAVAVALLLLLIPVGYWFARTAGFLPDVAEQPTEEPPSYPRAWWRDVERPAYFDLEIEAVDREFERRLEAALPEIEKARNEIDAISESERYKILAGPDAPVRKDALVLYRRYLEHFADAYRERTVDSGEARRLGEEFFAACLDLWAGVSADPDSVATSELGTAARKAGSEDPLLAALYYQHWQDDPRFRSEALEVFQESADRLEAEGYSADVVMTVRRLAWDVGRYVGRSEASEARKYLLVEAAVRFLAESADDPRSRFVWWRMHDVVQMLDESTRRALYVGALQNGTYNEFAMHMLAGWIYRNAAWEARGHGFAHTVSKSGWETFHKLMPRAAKHYMRGWLLDRTAPEPPTVMIEMGYAGGDDRWNAIDWFHVATRAELDHSRAYGSYSTSMKPRWGGSHRQQLAFAHKCLDTDRWDTVVPVYAFGTLRQIRTELGDGYPFGKLPGVMEVVDRYVGGVSRALAAGVTLWQDPTTNMAYFAVLYSQAGRYEEAHALFAAFGDDMLQQDFNWARTKLTYVRGLCAAMTGPANVDLPALRKWVEEPLPMDVRPEDLDAPLEELARLRALDDRDVVQPYWDDLAATLHHLQTYHRGEWVEFTPDENFSGMVLVADTHEVTEEGTLQIASGANTEGAVLRPLAWFEPPLLVEGEFAGWSEHPAEFVFGVCNGWPYSALYGDQHWRGVVLSSARDFVAISDSEDGGLDDRQHWPLESAGSEFHHLRLKLWPGVVDHYWRYGHLYGDEQFRRDVSGWVHFGGTYEGRSNSGQMRNLRVRKLGERPPARNWSSPEFLEYWRKEHEIDPRDAEANLYYGIALQYDKQHDEAARLLRLSRDVNPNRTILPYLIGVALVNGRRFAEGVAELEDAVGAGHNQSAVAFLSWVLSSVDDPSLRDPERALELAEQAREQQPDEWRTFRALAAAHARLGNFEPAADWMRQAVAAVEQDPDSQNQVDDLREHLKTIEAGKAIVMQLDD